MYPSNSAPSNKTLFQLNKVPVLLLQPVDQHRQDCAMEIWDEVDVVQLNSNILENPILKGPSFAFLVRSFCSNWWSMINNSDGDMAHLLYLMNDYMDAGYIYIYTYLNYSIHHDFRSWTFEVVKSNFGIFGVGKQRSLAYPSVSGGLFLGAVTENGLSWDMSQRGDPRKITRKLFCWWNICHVRLFVEFSTPQKILDKIHRDQKNAE